MIGWRSIELFRQPITLPDSCFRFASRQQIRLVENGLYALGKLGNIFCENIMFPIKILSFAELKISFLDRDDFLSLFCGFRYSGTAYQLDPWGSQGPRHTQQKSA